MSDSESSEGNAEQTPEGHKKARKIDSFCEKFIRSPKDPLYILELIALLPVYDRIAFDVVEDKPVIQRSGGKTWDVLGKKTYAPLRDAVSEQLLKYKKELDGETKETTGEDVEDDETSKIHDEIRRLGRFSAFWEDILPNLVKEDELHKHHRCLKFQEGWMLCEDDVLVRLDIASNGLLCVETAELSISDYYLESMRVYVKSSGVIEAIREGNAGIEIQSRLLDFFKAAWADLTAFRFQHAILAYAFWLKRLSVKQKQILITMSDSDTAKDSQLINPLRNLAPGLVGVLTDEWLYGIDRTKLAQEKLTKGYAHMEVHTDANLSRVDFEKIRTLYGNYTESASREARLSTYKTVAELAQIFLCSNYEKYPERGIADTDQQKFLAVMAHTFNEHGVRIERVMNRFVNELTGEKIEPSEEDASFCAEPYTAYEARGTKWAHTAEAAKIQLNQLALAILAHSQGNAGKKWNPKRGRPDHLVKQLEYYDKGRKRQRGAITSMAVVSPEIAGMQCTATFGDGLFNGHEAPEEVLKTLVDLVSKAFVANVPGKWITQQV